MKRLLIIEDDDLIAKAYEQRFMKEGFQVYHAQDGETGIEMVYGMKPDVVLLDLMLPKVNGVEFLKTIRSRPNFQSLPIIVVSNAFLSGMIQDAWQAGASQIIPKGGHTLKQIVAMVRIALDPNDSPSSPASMIVAGETPPVVHPVVPLQTQRPDTAGVSPPAAMVQDVMPPPGREVVRSSPKELSMEVQVKSPKPTQVAASAAAVRFVMPLSRSEPVESPQVHSLKEVKTVIPIAPAVAVPVIEPDAVPPQSPSVVKAPLSATEEPVAIPPTPTTQASPVEPEPGPIQPQMTEPVPSVPQEAAPTLQEMPPAEPKSQPPPTETTAGPAADQPQAPGEVSGEVLDAGVSPEISEESDREFRAEIRKSFLQTSAETVNSLRHLLRAFIQDVSDTRHLLELCRRVHSIAGNTGMSGLHSFSRMSAAAEALLHELHQNPQIINPSVLRTVAQSVDFLSVLLEEGSFLEEEPEFQASVLVLDDEDIARKTVSH